MIKLNYKKIECNGLAIYYAKYKKNRNIRMTINKNCEIKVTCPYYCSEYDVMEFVHKQQPWIEKIIKKQKSLINLADKDKLSKEQKKILLNKLMILINKYESLMNTKVNHITIREMKSLWGSCSFKTHNIRFNAKLYFMSDEYVEYVVVHEMAHIFVPNHSKSFKDIVKRYIPNYKIIEKEGRKVLLR